MTLKVARGKQNHPFDATFREGTGGPLTNADPVTIDILDPDDVEVVSNASPTSNPSTGLYVYEHDVATDAELGLWKIVWSGVINENPVSGTEIFEVVVAGSVEFDDETFATLQEFEERKGDVEADQEDIVTALLKDATALIRDEAADSTTDWVAGTDAAPRVIKHVCIEVAYRAWANPDALTQSSIADSSLSYASPRPQDALFLTDAEKRTVHRASGTSSMLSVTLVTPYSGDTAVIDPDVGDL